MSLHIDRDEEDDDETRCPACGEAEADLCSCVDCGAELCCDCAVNQRCDSCDVDFLAGVDDE